MSDCRKKAVEDVLAADAEHLARVIADCIREAEKYRAEEGPLAPEAFRALDKAILVAEKLNDRLWRLRGELDAIVGG